MPILTYNQNQKVFIWKGSFDDRLLAETANFRYEHPGLWITANKYQALDLIDYADLPALEQLVPVKKCIKESLLIEGGDPVPVPNGLSYLPFQISGIHYAKKSPTVLIADEMGLGKTIQAIGLANLIELKKILVICPASLRLKWARELKKWHLYNQGVQVILNGKQQINPKINTIISYELAVLKIKQLMKNWDLIILDEAHYLKSWKTKRTRAILGTRGKPGLIKTGTYVLPLTGTPMLNRPHELFPLLNSCAPHVIDYLRYREFEARFCQVEETPFGVKVVGAKNQKELGRRLRGSGFMVRRLKKVVLPQLPDKQYNLIVFQGNRETARIIEKERPFNAEEIIQNGMPVGSALPEIRHAMGFAKIPVVIPFYRDLLEELYKLLIFAHHTDVIRELADQLKMYHPVTFTGQHTVKQKQEAESVFLDVKECKVFIGNMRAAGLGLDLVVAHNVAFHEADWVSSVNDQCIDRLHRIGQKHKVNVFYPVIEESLDAYILSRAAEKQYDINQILDGVK